jgi:HAMP domain-containing protein
LKDDGITDFTFHTQELDPAVFLRLSDPASSGDHMGRFMDKQVATTLTMVTGNEMGKAGFAVRTIAPMFGSHGEVAGYVEFGEELGQFLHGMKTTTGDDYGLLIDKKYVNQQFWADSNAALNRRNNWNDAPNYVMGDKTSNSDRIFDFKGDLSAVPANGEALERYHEGKSEFVRGVFPIQDVAGNRVGAIFVVRDITNFYLSMQHTEIIFAVSTAVAVLIGTGIFLFMLSRLVFQRLERIIRVATRVVGGDHGTEIQVSSDDEVGQLEQLFEQFRQVFVYVLSSVTELEKDGFGRNCDPGISWQTVECPSQRKGIQLFTPLDPVRLPRPDLIGLTQPTSIRRPTRSRVFPRRTPPTGRQLHSLKLPASSGENHMARAN